MKEQSGAEYFWTFLFLMAGILLIYGILLPDDWQRSFGPFAKPILWASQIIPSVRKIVASSSTPNYLAGLLGFATYIPVVTSIYSIKSIYSIQSYEDIEKLMRPFWGQRKITPFLKIFSLVVVCLITVVLISFIYFLPFYKGGIELRIALETDSYDCPGMIGRYSLFTVIPYTYAVSASIHLFIINSFILLKIR